MFSWASSMQICVARGSLLRSVDHLTFRRYNGVARLVIIMPMRLKLIACEIMYRELCAAVARSVNLVDVEFLPKGLHDIGQAGMSSRLAEVLAGVDETRYEAILLGYGLCSNGLVGLAARSIPLVVPRAHDCITLFLGSKERYLEYFQGHPGVYFKTSGWIERGVGLHQGERRRRTRNRPCRSRMKTWWPATAKTTPSSFTRNCATCGTTPG